MLEILGGEVALDIRDAINRVCTMCRGICLYMGMDRCRMNLACLRDWNGGYQRRDKSRLYAEREEEICLYIKINIG